MYLSVTLSVCRAGDFWNHLCHVMTCPGHGTIPFTRIQPGKPDRCCACAFSEAAFGVLGASLNPHWIVFLSVLQKVPDVVGLFCVQALPSSVLCSEDDPVPVEEGQHPSALTPLSAEPTAGHVDFIR